MPMPNSQWAAQLNHQSAATAPKPPSTPSTGRLIGCDEQFVYKKADYDSYCETEFLNKDNLQYLSNSKYRRKKLPGYSGKIA